MNNLFNAKSIVRIFAAIMIANGVASIFEINGILKLLVFIVVYYGVSQVFFYAIDPLMEDAAKKQKEQEAEESQTSVAEAGYAAGEIEDSEEEANHATAFEPQASQASQSAQHDAWSEFSPYFLLSLTDSISGLPRGSLNGETSFQPIHNEERQVPYYQNESNQIFVTEDAFFKWAIHLENIYQVEIPKKILYPWVQGTNLNDINNWLETNGTGPEETIH